MLTLILLIGLGLAVVLGFGPFSIAGLAIALALWVVLYPIRWLLRLVFALIGAVFGLAGAVIGGLFGLLGGLIGLVAGPFGIIVGGLVLLCLALAALAALLVPLVPLVIIVLAGWALYRVCFRARAVTGV